MKRPSIALTLAASLCPAQDPVRVDLTDRSDLQVVVDREPGQYLGHVSTVLLEDGRTILATYPKGHGRGAIVYKRSEDGGRTWSKRLPVPESWATSQEVPTIHRVIDKDDKRRLIVWSGLHPARLAHSEDDGRTWSELEPAGDWGGIVVMGDVIPTKTKGRYLAWFHDDGRFLAAGGKASGEFQLLQVESLDGGLSWSQPRTLWRGRDLHLCEPGAVRSPNGSEISLLLRENARRQPSHFIRSTDEGSTWSEPSPIHPALTGDRHTIRYLPDGRLVAVFRDTALGKDNATAGDFVAWIGSYDDIAAGRGGDYHVRLLDNTNRWDCGYPGLHVLEDGTIVATTYGHWQQGDQPYIVCVRFGIDDIRKAAGEKERPRKSAAASGLEKDLETLIAYTPTRRAPTDEAIVRAEQRLRRAMPRICRGNGPVRDRLTALLSQRREQLTPSAANRIHTADPLARVLVAFDDRVTQETDARSVTAHPAAQQFPGSVPGDAERVRASATIDLRRFGRHSLGLYAPPGAHIEALVIAADGTPLPEGLQWRIGAHSDNIARRPAWPRMPRISRTFPVGEDPTTIANAYGGLIYLESSQPVDRKLEIVIDGAVTSPRFVLGQTDPQAWQNGLRMAPGPWAELETDKVVLTVPSARIRNLEDPTKVLELWNQILDCAADLATISRTRARPQRYVADVEITNGAMHAGYPIMTHLNAATDMVIHSRLLSGSWGLFHELGHNHQQKDWTFKGTGEVTVNLFSLYICEILCDIPWDRAWGGNLARAQQRLADHVRAGRKPWQQKNKNGGDDLALRLLMYSQVQRAFGWEAFGHTFAEYRDLPADERPRTEQEKRDQWLVRLSRAIHRNLGPFFVAWGVEVSETALQEVADMTPWWPDDWPSRG
jgi:hypothetical protein